MLSWQQLGSRSKEQAKRPEERLGSESGASWRSGEERQFGIQNKRRERLMTVDTARHDYEDACEGEKGEPERERVDKKKEGNSPGLKGAEGRQG